jgi:hypothetical protein
MTRLVRSVGGREGSGGGGGGGGGGEGEGECEGEGEWWRWWSWWEQVSTDVEYTKVVKAESGGGGE